MSVPQWNADIITPASESGGTQVIGDNQEVQSTLESGDNITIEDGRISSSGGGAEYTAGDGIAIDGNNAISADVDGTTIGIDASTKKIKLLSTIPTVDQTYNASSTNAQSGVAVAGALANINQVPSSTSADEDKVLTVDSNGDAVWATAQGGAQYSAGVGIDITSNTITADIDNSTIVQASNTVTGSLTELEEAPEGYNSLFDSTLSTVFNSNSNTQVTIHIPGHTFYTQDALSASRKAAICLTPMLDENNKWYQQGAIYLATDLTATYDSDLYAYFLDEQDVTVSVPVSSPNWYDWKSVNNQPTATYYSITFVIYTPGDESESEMLYTESGLGEPGHTVTYSISTPTNKICVANPVPASTSVDENKVLTVNSSGKAVWATPATVTVDQTYNASSTNAQSGVAVASAISGISVDEVPTVGSSDDGKVLTASYSGGQGSYSWQTAQGGCAEYVGAPAVRVLDNVIDVKIGAGLEYYNTFNATASTIEVYFEEYEATVNVFDRIATLDSSLCNALDDGAIKAIDALLQIVPRPGFSSAQYLAYAIVPLDNGSVPVTPSSKLVFNYIGNTSNSMFFGAVLSLDNLTSESNLAWSTIKANPSSYALVLMRSDSSGSTSDTMFVYGGGDPVVNANTVKFARNISYIVVTNPLPISDQSEAGRVLTIDEYGNPRWEIHQLGTVTSIQKVNSLPASPVSTVLYLIPET